MYQLYDSSWHWHMQAESEDRSLGFSVLPDPSERPNLVFDREKKPMKHRRSLYTHDLVKTVSVGTSKFASPFQLATTPNLGPSFAAASILSS